MIDGLKFEFTSEYLKTHLVKRAEYHTRRANEKEATIPDLKRIVDDQRRGATAMSASYASQQNPVEALETDIKNHRKKARKFLLLAEHVIPNETFRLGYRDYNSEMEAIELLENTEER